MPTSRDVPIEALGEFQPTPDDFARLLEARSWVSTNLFARSLEQRSTADPRLAGYDNIVGLGLGLKEQGGKQLAHVVVRVFVRRKLPLDAIATEARVPTDIGGIQTDVVEIGEVRAGAVQQPTEYQVRYYNPPHRVPGGVSIGPCDRQETGTVAGLVRDANDRTYVLSNNHVLAGANGVAINAGIRQPGELDGGSCPADVVARLSKFVKLNFGQYSLNYVDAAIAQILPGRFTSRMRRQGGLEQLHPPLADPVVGLAVHKSGRTTGHTAGTIADVFCDVTVQYGPNYACFSGQMRVVGNAGAFSQRGDSGSLVTTTAGDHPVGLLFTSDATGSFANPIKGVLRELADKIPQIDPLEFVY